MQHECHKTVPKVTKEVDKSINDGISLNSYGIHCMQALLKIITVRCRNQMVIGAVIKVTYYLILVLILILLLIFATSVFGTPCIKVAWLVLATHHFESSYSLRS